MRNVVVATAMVLGLAGGTAYALSEWWTPKGKTCPVFDSEDACKDYCRADQKRCGGEVQCEWKTGEDRPPCDKPL